MPKPNQANGDSRRVVDEEAIARRAYELYLQRGSVPGYELDDWLAAEAELTAAASGKERGQDSGHDDEIGGRRDARAPEAAGDSRRPASRERNSPRRALRQ